MSRLQEAYGKAIDTQHSRQAAEIEVGACERYLYEARKADEPAAIEDARRKLRKARRDLHLAIDADHVAYEHLLAVEEDLDRKAEKRRAAKARRAARDAEARG